MSLDQRQDQQQAQHAHDSHQNYRGFTFAQPSHQQQGSHQSRHERSTHTILGGMTANTQLKKGRWSPTEDSKLMASIRRHGPNK